jgi:hypothetical protein
LTEGMPLTLEQSRQLSRSLTEKVLDKAISDPTWKQRLLEDPEAAMQEANFPEAQQIQRMQQEAEVRGHTSDLSDPSYGSPLCRRWTWRCYHWTWRWDQE